jgi:hypothetical protein
MGISHSSDRRLFEQVLCSLLRGRGIATSKSQIHRFVDFMQQVCPWFPEEGPINTEIRKKVGERIREHYRAHGPEKTPVDARSLWSLVRDCLRGDSEFEKRERGTRSSLRGTRSAEALSRPAPPVPTAPPAMPWESPRYEEPDLKAVTDFKVATAQSGPPNPDEVDWGNLAGQAEPG